jgi:hypothetical protein
VTQKEDGDLAGLNLSGERLVRDAVTRRSKDASGGRQVELRAGIFGVDARGRSPGVGDQGAEACSLRLDKPAWWGRGELTSHGRVIARGRIARRHTFAIGAAFLGPARQDDARLVACIDDRTQIAGAAHRLSHAVVRDPFVAPRVGEDAVRAVALEAITAAVARERRGGGNDEAESTLSQAESHRIVSSSGCGA